MVSSGSGRRDTALLRSFILIYGILCYGLALVSLVTLFLFLSNLGLDRSADSASRSHWLQALLVDAGLLVLFCGSHSGMARRGFKRWFERWLPPDSQRSSFVLVSAMTLLALCHAWQPVDLPIWHFDSPQGRGVFLGTYVFGWILVGLAIALTNHSDLFGLRQVWLSFRQQHYTRLPFTRRWIYGYIRHPLYLGWIFVAWSTPTMTAGHLLFAVFITIYIIVAIPLEEGDLVEAYGNQYERYVREVPKLIPTLRRPRAVTPGSPPLDRYVGPSDIPFDDRADG